MKGKLFFVINTLQGGGAERVVSTLAGNLQQRNFAVHIICLNYAESSYKIPPEIKVVYLVSRRGESVFYRLYYAGLTGFKLVNLLITEKPNTVISFMTSANLWTGITCLLTRTPYIVSERTTPDHTLNQFGRFLKCATFVIYSKAKAVVLPSRGIALALKKIKAFQHLTNLVVIKNPVTSFTSFSKQRVHSSKFILGVGRLSYEKGFDQLIEAYANIKSTDTDLLIAGEGIELESLRKQVDLLQLGASVQLIGSKSNLQDYYHQAEVFVLPSREEGYPNALIEAMSVGCPSIAMDCEFGPSEIINHGKNGLLIQDKNIKKMSESIFKVLSDPVLKAKLAANARLINHTNALDIISAKWEKIIVDL
ncbi:glycosyl transferase, group 1 [Arcticibacter svalbardensis MN12-7]|uniref:Glycosyl transferase, group 1 n=1 Tax=Arcticibacter svalbardensis MN12-7 TaxID=1150600 RepID=R9GQL2_9SPHI|nr:glycosyltransferase [Arcticibacter svalbardensis]EOR93830.1 glycosyl transferase, group 1 [Arcticibacter svalbardensis MN12-7]